MSRGTRVMGNELETMTYYQSAWSAVPPYMGSLLGNKMFNVNEIEVVKRILK